MPHARTHSRTMQRPSLSSIALSGSDASAAQHRAAADYDNTVDFGSGDMDDGEGKGSAKKKGDKKKTGGFQSFGQ